MTSAIDWVVYGGVSASVALILGLLLWTLHDQFGHEMNDEYAAAYGRLLRDLDDQRAAAYVQPAVSPSPMLSIHPLPEAERARFANDWQSLQPLFANDPDDAVKSADRLISDVMRSRGFPVGTFAQDAAELPIEQPEIVSHYREAHQLAQRAADGQATAAEERQALNEYRALFDELVGDGQSGQSPSQPIAHANS